MQNVLSMILCVRFVYAACGLSRFVYDHRLDFLTMSQTAVNTTVIQ